MIRPVLRLVGTGSAPAALLVAAALVGLPPAAGFAATSLLGLPAAAGLTAAGQVGQPVGISLFARAPLGLCAVVGDSAWPPVDAPRAVRPAASVSAVVSRYAGTVRYYGRVPDPGTTVVAFAGGQELARTTVQLTTEAASYELTVPSDDPLTPDVEGASEGQVLTFRVNGVPADEQTAFHAGEDRILDLTVTRVEVCLGAYEDLNRDGQAGPTDPSLAGVTINVAQFFVVRSYTTTGAAEPSCALHEAHPTNVRAVDWPPGFEPPVGPGQPTITIDPPEGHHTVLFAFVRETSAIETPTPLPSLTPLASATPTVSPTPTPEAELIVDSIDDPGEPGDGHLTLREALRLAVGDLWLEDLSAAELRRVTGQPGAASHDRIAFDPTVFPADRPVTIEVQPPISSRLLALGLARALRLEARRPNASLPALSTGGDILDGSASMVVLSAGQSLELFDGLVITSDDNVLLGLELRNFDAAVVVSGDARRNTLGGRGPGDGLTITNNITGIEILGSGARQNRVIGSRIGVERTGHAGPGNATYGVRIADGASGNFIGEPGAGNQISGNYVAGVAVVGNGSSGNVIVGNLIGTDAAGRQALGNGIGVVIGSGAVGTRIGGPRPFEGNVISGNVADGVWVQSAGTTGTLLQGNAIGTGLDRRWPLGNGGCGILISDSATQSTVGGPETGQANRIAFNDDAGVRIRGRDTVGHSVLGNSITQNRGPGIELAGGGNGGLVGPRLQRLGPGAVEGLALPGALVQVYSDSEDEGAALEAVAWADSRGRFRIELPAPPSFPTLTATTTDHAGNTSPFAREIPSSTAGPAEPTATDTLVPATPPTATESAAPTASEPGTAIPTDLATPTGTGTVTPAPSPNGTVESTATAPAITDTPPSTVAAAYLPVVFRDALLFSTVSLQPAESVQVLGTEIQLALVVDYVAGLRTAYFELAYPPELLTVLDADPLLPETQIEPGPFPDPTQAAVIDNRVSVGEGLITYGVAVLGPEPVSGSGVIARVRLVAEAVGLAELAWREVQLADSAGRRLPTVVRGARLSVVQATATATESPTPAATPEPTATATATESPTPVTTPEPTATATATESPTPAATPEPTAPATATESPTPAATPSPPVPQPTETEVSPPTAVTPEGSPTVSPSATAVPTEPSQFPPTSTSTATAQASGTPLASPTASSGPPGPTSSPTAVDECSRPMVSGGFEDAFGWRLRGGRLPRVVSAPVHGGERSMLLGILPPEPNELAYSTLWQSLEVPPAARTMTVLAWTYQAAEPGGGPDRQLILVYDVDPGDNLDFGRPPIARVVSERSDVRAWQRRALTFDVTGYRGRTLWLYATVLNDGHGGRTWMFLDDLEVIICP